jgi:mono/diheme cytochrome c family protein
MRSRSLLVASVLIIVSACGFGLSAQQAPPPARTAATAEIAEGRRVFHQKCSLCHVPPTKGMEPYGPRVSKARVNGREEAVREIIGNGVGRMPGFRYALEPAQIAAVIAYLKTLDAPPDRVVIDAPNP